MGQEAETLEAPAAIQGAETEKIKSSEALAQVIGDKLRPAVYLVFDTETSDLPNFKLPADDPGQARLAELAMVLLDQDLEIIGAKQIYVKPDGWSMQPGASAVNGLSDILLNEIGRPVNEALDQYVEAIEAGCVVIAHHAQFDTKILRGELRRADRDDLFEKTKQTCTMRSMQQWLKSQGRPAKWVKLEDAAAIAGYKLGQAHKGMDDAMACVAVFRWLSARGAMIEPKVHHGFGSVGGVDRRAAEE